MSMSEKYPLTEKPIKLREATIARWRFTLSGWIRLIRTPLTEEGRQIENQILDRIWEDKEFDEKIRKEYADWQAEEPEQDWRMEEIDPEKEEDTLRKQKRKSVRYGGKYKESRLHGEKRREP